MEKLAKYDTRKSLSPLGTGNTNQLVHLQSLNRLNRVHQCLELIHLRLKIKKKIFQKFNQTNFLKGLDILKQHEIYRISTQIIVFEMCERHNL